MTRALPAAVVAFALGGASLGSSQVFRGGTDTVTLSVTVTDTASHLVAGLSQADFQVFEDGVPQDLLVFSRDPQPIALALLLDASTSMEQRLSVAQEAAAGFVKRLKKTDVAQIIDFNNEIRIRQDFTGDIEALDKAIRQIRTGGSTSMYNAVYSAFVDLKRIRARSPEELRKQAIVLLSDGEDTTSLVTYDDVLDTAKRSEVTVYAIGLRAKEQFVRGAFNQADFVLRTLSQQTGGRAFFVDDVTQLPTIYTQIADELANQYLLGYSSKNTKRDGGWRQISIRVARENAVARTKSGYFAPRR